MGVTEEGVANRNRLRLVGEFRSFQETAEEPTKNRIFYTKEKRTKNNEEISAEKTKNKDC